MQSFDTARVANRSVGIAEATDAEDDGAREDGPAPVLDAVPLTAAQRGIWFAQQLAGSVPVSIAHYVDLRGPVDAAALEAAMISVGRQFGSGFVRIVEEDGVPAQVVDLSITDTVRFLDLREDATPVETAIEWMRAECAAPLDMTSDRLVVTYLIRVEDERYFWYCRIHHIVLDGFGAMTMIRQVAAHYTALVEGREPTPTRAGDLRTVYDDDVAYRESTRFENDRRHWAEKFETLPTGVSFVDSTAPVSVPCRAASGRTPVEVAESLAKGVDSLGTTTVTLAIAAFSAFVSRTTGTTDVVLSLPVSGRASAVLRRSGGMVSNVVPLVVRVDAAATVSDVIDRVQRELTGALRRQRYRHEDIRRDAGEMTNTRGLFGPTVNLMMFDNEIVLGDVRGSYHVLTTGPVEDLSINLYPAPGDGDELQIDFESNPNLYTQQRVEDLRSRFLDYLRRFSHSAADGRVLDIEVLSPHERATLVPARGASSVRPRRFVDVIDDAVAGSPDAIAVETAHGALTYAQMDASANRIARLLVSRGAGPETTVAIALPRSLHSILSTWAVARTGAAFLPIDPALPTARILHLVSDSGAVLGITDTTRAGSLPDALDWLAIDAVETDRLVSQYSPARVTDAHRLSPIHLETPAWMIYTSGSTGLPKGVVVGNGGVANLTRDIALRLDVESSSRVLALASPSFDSSLFEMLSALSRSATLVVSPADVFGGEELARYLSEKAVTHVTITPAALASVDPDGLDHVQHVVTAGEACPPDLVARWGTGRRMYNAYGPTEITMISHMSRPLDPAAPITVGRLVRGASCLVLDPWLRPVPEGVVGELYLSGPSVARGYVHAPGVTSGRFVASPYEPGARMYRTGDLVRWSADTEIAYVGRADFQIKIRGMRVELGEVDAVLSMHESVRASVTIAHRPSSGSLALASYVVLQDGRTVDSDEIHRFAVQSLPSHMVPSSVMVLDALPITVQGKIDRRSLPEPVVEVHEFRAPSMPVEEIVASVFGELLGVDRVGRDDDFFALGGNSLIATRAVARLGKALDTTVTVRTLFEAPSVAALAARVQFESGVPPRPPLVRRTAADSDALEDAPPLSYAQRRMWFLNRFDPTSAAYNIPFAVRLVGDLDVPALQVAMLDVIDRHESLRTMYPDTPNGPVQLALTAESIVPDLTPVDVHENALPSAVAALAGRAFDVTEEVPVAATLFRTAYDTHVLAVVVHHISADGASMAPLARDLMAAYSARVSWFAPTWAPLPVQYADFSVWQRDALGDENDPESVIAQQERYWLTALADLPDELPFPVDRSRPTEPTYAGASHTFSIEPELHAALVDVARAHSSTLFMVVHSILAIVLARHSGTDDVTVGTPVAGRGDAAVDDMIGMFVNTLALRTRVDVGAGYRDLLAHIREQDLGAFAHADVPFERLVEVIDPPRSRARHPIFQVLLSFQNLGQAHFELTDLRLETVEFDLGVAKFDLQFTLVDSLTPLGAPDGLAATIAYATDLFDRETIGSLAERFVAVARAVAADPDVVLDEIDLLGGVERERVTAPVLPEGTTEAVSLTSRFRRRAAENPDATALVDAAGSHTYGDFAARVNRVARSLVERGVGPEVAVVVALPRSVDALVAVYAVLEAGGAYVPVDPEQPAARIDQIVAATAARCVVVAEPDALPVAGEGAVSLATLDDPSVSSAPLTDTDRTGSVRAGTTAYVIFTSGSTGVPKGVSVPHGAVTHQVDWFARTYALTENDVVLAKTPMTFDVSVWEMFATLAVGGTLAVADADGHRDPEYLMRAISRYGVTAVSFVPSMFAVFTEAADDYACRSLRLVFLAGEALGRAAVDTFREKCDIDVHNLYGPTEFAVHATAHPVGRGEPPSVPIGIPVDGTAALVLDGRFRPVPDGVVGELYLCGVQAARGYHGRPDLTADRFVALPGHDGARMYRTGDLARWNHHGHLEFAGRVDHQVKLRGLRIELGEVEAAVSASSRVARSVAIVRDDTLVAYVVPAPGATVDTDLLRADAARILPAYMVPVVVVLDALPVSASGKLDRSALPDPVVDVQRYRAPRTQEQRVVAEVLAELLGVERVGLNDNFFALGGNSLVATRVAARIGDELGVRVPLRAVFDAATVADLADSLDTVVTTSRHLTSTPRPEVVPLAPAQQRLWLANRVDPTAATYNLPMGLRLTGPLDVDALRVAVDDVVARHETLRTVYPDVDGHGRQSVLAPVGRPLTPIPVTEAELAARVVAVATTPFDVTTQVPLRVELFRLGDEEHVLVVVVHHIAADGFSIAPLTVDVVTAFASRTAGVLPAWTPLEVQYADYALWHRTLLGDPADPESVSARQLAYWRETLAGLPGELSLPQDRPRPPAPSGVGASVRFEIPAQTYELVRDLARERRATPFMVVHAALSVALSRISGSTDICVGTAVAGRGSAELDPLVGMLVNTLVLRLAVDEDASVVDLVDDARGVALSAFAHADVPFDTVVDTVAPARSSSLFRVALAYQNTERSEIDLSGLHVEQLQNPFDPAQFDLTLTIEDSPHREHSDPVTGIVTYATDLFDEATAATFATVFSSALDAVVADPGGAVSSIALASGPSTDADEPVAAAVQTSRPQPVDLPSMITASVEADPGAPAYARGEFEISWAEMDARSNRIARVLLAEGGGPGRPVTPLVEAPEDRIAATWAAAKIGATLTDADTAIRVTSDDRFTQGPVGPLSAADGIVSAGPGDPLVALGDATLTHAALASCITADSLQVTHESRVAVAAGAPLDLEVLAVVVAAAAGATTVSLDASDDLADALADEWVTHVVLSESQLASLDTQGLDDLEVIVVSDADQAPAAAPLDVTVLTGTALRG
ncbi:amino acid adenylation domain-containing protein [Rhodococcus sp. BP-241]|uniref:non-ribosomal peptide synthetase n=1 Tax=Rhodococcus sp. BP-241 TaxID=2739441 RepID=UPI001C9A3DB7|nr:non-ribosomal peptide synthetase [Rhodococcus sp. BP-241]MBY6706004.1 amino acid adenylation domain-containing protein [Rhodococcus sp. BP-241]